MPVSITAFKKELSNIVHAIIVKNYYNVYLYDCKIGISYIKMILLDGDYFVNDISKSL